MKGILKSKQLLLIFFIILGGAGFLLLLRFRNFQGKNNNNDSKVSFYQKERSNLSKMFQEKGVEVTYRYFKDNYTYYDSIFGHHLGHFVGNQIYKILGMEGLLKCDNSMKGCIHGFVAKAVSETGMNFLPQGEAICQKRENSNLVESCYHGIGHGILILKGFTVDNLIQSLQMCDKLRGDFTIFCRQGVFMEYNFRFEHQSGISRELVTDDYFTPCTSLPQQYQAECYFQQSSWWSTVLPEQYERMGQLCDELKSSLHKEKCFQGLGFTLVEKKKYDPTAIAGECQRMPQKAAVLWCMQSAVRVLKTAKILGVEKMCDIMNNADRIICEQN